MKKTSILSGIVAVSLLLGACSKEGNEAPGIDKTNDGTFKVFTEGGITTVQNLNADTIIGIAPTGQPYGSGRFTFFSLENKARVSGQDSASLKWDIAFRGTTLLVNGGSSGPGNGGAFIWRGAFEALKNIPADSVFRVDNAPSYAITAGSGRGWYNYDGPANLVTPLPGRILVIRTASGKYAKLEILNYYRKGQTPAVSDPDDLKIRNQRYFLFRYTYAGTGVAGF